MARLGWDETELPDGVGGLVSGTARDGGYIYIHRTMGRRGGNFCSRLAW